MFFFVSSSYLLSNDKCIIKCVRVCVCCVHIIHNEARVSSRASNAAKTYIICRFVLIIKLPKKLSSIFSHLFFSSLVNEFYFFTLDFVHYFYFFFSHLSIITAKVKLYEQIF